MINYLLNRGAQRAGDMRIGRAIGSERAINVAVACTEIGVERLDLVLVEMGGVDVERVVACVADVVGRRYERRRP